MKKTNVLWVIAFLLFLSIFNTIFFTCGGINRTVSVWISYGFIHYAYLMLLANSFLIKGGKSAAVFGFSLYSISSVYFIVGLITGVIFILVSPTDYKAAMLVQLFIAGLYTVMLISNIIANEHTAEAEEKRQYQIDYVKNAKAEMSSILNAIKDSDVKKKPQKVYDAINASPVKSYPSLSSLETQILIAITIMKKTISDNNKEEIILQSETLLTMVNERNRQLRLLH